MSSLQLYRYFHSTLFRNMSRRLPRRANPGINYHINELGESEPFLEDPEGFGDLESDFLQVYKSHRAHEAQLKQQRERVRQFTVKHKYFRDEKLPNLLTYAEKEQIRLLNARDPEEWTVERLAESFPATPGIIEKLLRAKWRPSTTERIRVHDASVIRNWKQFRAGKCETSLPPALIEHLKKFADRKLGDLKAITFENWPTRTPLAKTSGTEFQSLITSCAKYAAKEAPQIAVETQKLLLAAVKNDQPTGNAPYVEETHLMDKVYDKRKMRLQELKQFKLTQEELAMSKQAEIEQQSLAELANPSGTGIVRIDGILQSSNLPSIMDKFESTEIVISAGVQNRFEMSKVKERIHIPRKLWRNGATYRVEDAYYDDDGEFLYSVPGMTGKFNVE